MKQLVLALLMAGPLVLWPAWAAAAPQPTFEPSAASPQKIPFKTEGALSARDIFRVIGGLVVAVGVAFAAAFLLKRYGALSYQSGPGNRIKVIEVRRLLPKTTVLLIEADGTRLLLGQQGDRLTVLHTYSNGEAVDKPR